MYKNFFKIKMKATQNVYILMCKKTINTICANNCV